MSVSREQWRRYAVHKLPNRALEWPTMRKMVFALRDPERYANPQHVELAKQARDLLVYGLLPSPVVVPVREQDTPLAEYLVAEGAAVRNGDGRFRVRSDFVRTLVLSKVVGALQRSPPPQPFPFSSSGGVDVAAMLAGALPHFDAAHIKRAKDYCAKMVNKVDVPREAAYWAELFAVLVSWKPERLSLDVEYTRNLEGNSRCDLFLSTEEQAVALELMASNTPHEITEHYRRVGDYAAATGASEAWVVHFIAAECKIRVASSGDFPAPPEGVHAIHIIHDSEFQSVSTSRWDADAQSWLRTQIGDCRVSE
jgi:hypothetical protein